MGKDKMELLQLEIVTVFAVWLREDPMGRKKRSAARTIVKKPLFWLSIFWKEDWKTV